MLLSVDPKSPNEIEEAFAAISTQFGKQEALGKWTYVQLTNEDFFLADPGNTLTLGGASYLSERSLGYVLLSETTMVMSLRMANLVLTIPTATQTVYVRIPAGYRSVGRQATSGVINDNGTIRPAWLLAGGTDGRHVQVARADFGNLTGGLLDMYFQIMLEVQRT